ncbi:hypothetical protein [Acinetobacter sp.]|uniref:hypothetical protein n=1 Tax=Acinetobacter sp. TaxID=472 RepID=UPI00388DC017
MSKKNLKDKIRQVGFWTFSGVFWYLVISFFLLSDYPIQDQPFNGKDAYMVVKDALGLAAAFLAPVAAFMLFQDWREQHTKISNDQLSRKIITDLKEIECLLNYLTARNGQDKFLIQQSRILEIIHQITIANNDLYTVNKSAEDFKNTVIGIRKDFISILMLESNIGVLSEQIAKNSENESKESKNASKNASIKMEALSNQRCGLQENFKQVLVDLKPLSITED